MSEESSITGHLKYEYTEADYQLILGMNAAAILLSTKGVKLFRDFLDKPGSRNPVPVKNAFNLLVSANKYLHDRDSLDLGKIEDFLMLGANKKRIKCMRNAIISGCKSEETKWGMYSALREMKRDALKIIRSSGLIENFKADIKQKIKQLLLISVKEDVASKRKSSNERWKPRIELPKRVKINDTDA